MILTAKVVRTTVGGPFVAEIHADNKSKLSCDFLVSITGQLLNYSVTHKQHQNDCPETLKSLTCPRSGKSFVEKAKLDSGSFENVSLCHETQPRIIVSEKSIGTLKNGIFVYEEHIPENWYPSYNGRCIRYKTKLSLQLIFTQEKKLKSFSVSVRIFPTFLTNPELRRKFGEMYVLGNDDEIEDPLKRTNPFAITCLDQQRFMLYRSLCSEDCKDLGRGTNSSFLARISDSNGEISKVHLSKLHYQIGEPIVGYVDLSATSAPATRMCAQFAISLVAVETLLKDGSRVEVNHLTSAETCVGKELVGFQLRPNETITPNFKTDTFCLNWILKFEFVLAPINKPQSMSQEYWRAPTKVLVKTRKWEIPITIYTFSQL